MGARNDGMNGERRTAACRAHAPKVLVGQFPNQELTVAQASLTVCIAYALPPRYHRRISRAYISTLLEIGTE